MKETWSCSTNPRLPFVANVTLNLSVIAFFSPFPVVHMRRSCLASSLPQSSTKVSRVVHCYLQDAHPAVLVPPSPSQPGHFCVDGGRDFNNFGGGGGFIFWLDTASSIFPNIFVQDCRLSYGTNCFDYHFHYKNLPQLSQSVNVVTTWHQIEITIFWLLPKTGSLNE